MSPSSPHESLVEAVCLLGLRLPFDRSELERRYRKLAAIYHPDNPKSGDAQEFQKLSSAKDLLLKNEQTLAKYRLSLVQDLGILLDDSTKLLDELTDARKDISDKERETMALRLYAVQMAKRASLLTKVLAVLSLIFLVASGGVAYAVFRGMKPEAAEVAGASIPVKLTTLPIFSPPSITVGKVTSPEGTSFRLDGEAIRFHADSLDKSLGEISIPAGVASVSPDGTLSIAENQVLGITYFNLSVIVDDALRRNLMTPTPTPTPEPTPAPAASPAKAAKNPTPPKPSPDTVLSVPLSAPPVTPSPTPTPEPTAFKN